MTSTWSGEVALVTGAAGSIGSVIVAHLASLGARVAGADARPVAGPGRFDVVDVTKSAEVDRWVASISADWGPPTIAVVCAGTTWAGRLIDQSDSDWQRVMAVNLDASFFTARAAIRQMRDAGRPGRIVFVGSWAAEAPHPHIGNYSVSKAGLRMLCRTLALDHAADGILVNEVAPGIVEAGLSRDLFERDPELARRTRAAVPLGRFTQAEEIARQVAFLASPDNVSMTGAVCLADGGLSLASSMNPG